MTFPADIAEQDAPRQRDLAVTWMNRGQALRQRGEDVSSLQAYAEAIALLRDVPHDRNPSWRNSLAAALMNRGQLLHRLHGIGHASAALASFDEAAVLLRTLPGGDSPWPRHNLSGTLLNRACLLLDLGRFHAACTAAREALALASPAEKTDLVDADLALKSRRALCDALGQLLVEPGVDQESLAGEASDIVDDALELIRFWNEKGASNFPTLAVRLFRYGAQLYRLHQPHFLAEFILENIALGRSAGAQDEVRAIARENLDAALQARSNRGRLTMGDPASERWRQTWQELEAVRRQLASAA